MANDKRFEVVYSQGRTDIFRVIRDNETGVHYLNAITGGGVALTVLLDEKGNPVIGQNCSAP